MGREPKSPLGEGKPGNSLFDVPTVTLHAQEQVATQVMDDRGNDNLKALEVE